MFTGFHSLLDAVLVTRAYFAHSVSGLNPCYI